MYDASAPSNIIITQHRAEKPFYQNRPINKVLSTFGSMRGMRAESRAVRAWRPKWRNRRRYAQVFTQIRGATPYEDNVEKYDLVFETVIPGYERLGIQIKTNMAAHTEFMKKYPKVPVVLISDFDSSFAIRRKTLFMLLHGYRGLAEEMAKRGCQISPRMLTKLADIQPGELFCLF